MTRYTVSLEQIENDDMEGICIACGEIQDGCEPDARKYTCESCGKKTVYGLSQAMLEELIDVE